VEARLPTGALRVGSRTSALARWQTERVLEALRTLGQEAVFVGVETKGDRYAGPLVQEAGDGLFVSALEDALVAGEIDLAVHSLKDVPARADGDLEIVAVLERHDPADAVVGRPLAALAPGARVGTSSPRRAAFVRALRPDVEIVPVRGNVPRRVALVGDGGVDAVVLALAGLERLGLDSAVAERLAPDRFPPAPGQGAIAVQARRDHAAAAIARALDHAQSRLATDAERLLLSRLGGGCDLPLGAWARPGAGAAIRLTAHLVGADGVYRTADVEGDTPAMVAAAAQARLVAS
jgi:hydroxymethylbilane synthase